MCLSIRPCNLSTPLAPTLAPTPTLTLWRRATADQPTKPRQASRQARPATATAGTGIRRRRLRGEPLLLPLTLPLPGHYGLRSLPPSRSLCWLQNRVELLLFLCCLFGYGGDGSGGRPEHSSGSGLVCCVWCDAMRGRTRTTTRWDMGTWGHGGRSVK